MLQARNTGHDGSITTCHTTVPGRPPDRNHGADGRYRTTLKSHQEQISSALNLRSIRTG